MWQPGGCWDVAHHRGLRLLRRGIASATTSVIRTSIRLDRLRVVVNTTGDGRPDWQFGVDTSPASGKPRMWRTDLATGRTIASDPDHLEDPGVMDEEVPVQPVPDPQDNAQPAHIWVRHPDRVLRFYTWASVIADGQVIATDNAPDLRWIEYRPQPHQ